MWGKNKELSDLWSVKDLGWLQERTWSVCSVWCVQRIAEAGSKGQVRVFMRDTLSDRGRELCSLLFVCRR